MSIDINQVQFILERIATINDEMGAIQIDVAILKTQMATIIWWFRAVAGGFILMVLGQIWQIKILRKNNRNNK